MSKAPKRHEVTIKRKSPNASLDGHGQPTGATMDVATAVPCSIEPLTGRELEHAKMVVANATQRVTFYDDPAWNLTTQDWLEFGNRRLNIGSITHDQEIELEAVCLCAEAA